MNDGEKARVSRWRRAVADYRPLHHEIVIQELLHSWPGADACRDGVERVVSHPPFSLQKFCGVVLCNVFAILLLRSNILIMQTERFERAYKKGHT